MSKKRIAIASVLKPIDDTRSYKKIAQSLAKNSDYSITLVGPSYRTKGNIKHKKIEAIFTSVGKPLSLRRIYIPLIIGYNLIKLKPHIIIVNSYELLIVMIINQIIFGSKIVYDIQENYYLNLITQRNYTSLIKYPVAGLIRLKERLTSPFITHFILAEKCYSIELPFLGTKYTTIENKAQKIQLKKNVFGENEKLKFLFSGNISRK